MIPVHCAGHSNSNTKTTVTVQLHSNSNSTLASLGVLHSNSNSTLASLSALHSNSNSTLRLERGRVTVTSVQDSVQLYFTKMS